MRKMLFIGVGYHNYDQHIQKAFEKKGYIVDYISDRPRNFMLYKTLLGDFWFKQYERFYLHNIAKKIKETNYEVIVVVVGHFLTSHFLEYLHQKYKEARFILYLWDNVARVPNFNKTKQYYEKIYSFDLTDCQIHGFEFLPLFYSEKQDKNEIINKYDYLVYSAMVNHSNRYRIIRTFLEKYKDEPMLFYLIVGRKNGLLRKIFKNYKFDFIDKRLFYSDRAISEFENYELTKKSKSILDVQYSGQTGLTMRTIETLGSSKKLITTNQSIKYYDFYDPTNIQIINQNEIIIDIPLLKSDYKQIPKEIFDKYSIDSWAETLLGLKKNTYLGKGYNLSNIEL